MTLFDLLIPVPAALGLGWIAGWIIATLLERYI